MKTSFLKTIPGMALATMLGLTVAQVLVFAQDTQDTRAENSAASKIEGVWDVRVTIRRCDTSDPIRSVRAMNMFIDGGTLTETSGQIPTFQRGPGLGTWDHLGGKRNSAIFRFFLFNADGSLAGTRKITRNIELSKDAKEFTAVAVIETFDANGHLIETGCATEIAARLE